MLPILLFSIFSFTASASTSTDFFLDYETLSTGADNSESSSFEMLSGIKDIVVNSSSTSYNLTTINLIPDTATFACGNGVIDPGELCDGTNFGGVSCSSYGFNQGSLTCLSCTVIDHSACSNSSETTVIPTDGGPIYHIGSENEVKEEDEGEEDPVSEPDIPEETEITEPKPQEPEDTESSKEDPAYRAELESEQKSIPKQVTYTPPADTVFVPKTPPADEQTQFPQEPPTTQKPHLTYYEKAEIIKTVDNKPVLADQLKPDTEYVIKILDERGEVIDQEYITTDKEGNYIYETPFELDAGIYDIKIYEMVAQNEKSYRLNIIDKEYPKLRIEKFGEISYPPVNTEYQVDLGAIGLDTDLLINGYTVPETKIIVYFQNKKIYTVEATADENGYFELKIPTELNLGPHTATIVQIYPDNTISKNLVYRFLLIETSMEQKEVKEQSPSFSPEIKGKFESEKAQTILYLILFTLGLIIAVVLAQKPLHK